MYLCKPNAVYVPFLKITMHNLPSLQENKNFIEYFFANDKIVAVFFAILSLVFYGNTFTNLYSLDDYIINDNQYVNKGFEGIPSIFVTHYINDESGSYEYRPLVMVSYAIEFAIFGKNAMVGHIINTLLYALTVIYIYFLFRKKLLPQYAPVLPFLITFLFCIHPIHTEVVASLKNRDEILALLFSLISLGCAMQYYNTLKVKDIIISIIFLSLAMLSKKSSMVFLGIIPLTVYFFTPLTINITHIKERLKTLKSESIDVFITFYIAITYLLQNLFATLPIFRLITLSVQGIMIIWTLYTLYRIFKENPNKAQRSKALLSNGTFFLIGAALSPFILMTVRIVPLAIVFLVTLCYIIGKLKARQSALILVGFLMIGFIVQIYYINNVLIKFPNQGQFIRGVDFFENPLYYQDGLTYRLGTGFYVLCYYLRLLIFPHPLACYYGYNQIPILSATNTLAIFSFLALLIIGIYALLGIKNKNLASYGILFFFISMSLFANIIEPLPGIVADRFAYAGSLGYCIVLAYFLAKIFKLLPTANPNTPPPRSTLIPLLITILLITVPAAAKTITRNKDWYNTHTLYKADVTAVPQSTKVHHLYAQDLMFKIQNGQITDSKTINTAEKHFKESVEIYPNFTLAWQNLGVISYKLGKYEDAITSFQAAIKQSPYYAEALCNLAFSYEKLGKYREAILACKQTIQANPNSQAGKVAKDLLEKIYTQQQTKLKETEETIKTQKPTTVKEYDDLAKLYYLNGNYPKAFEAWEAALKIEPQNPRLLYKIYNAYKEQGDSIKRKFYEKEFNLYNR